MPKDVCDISDLKEYVLGVLSRAEHHAKNVTDVIYPLITFVLLEEGIKVRFNQYGETANELWFKRGEKQYRVRYEHADKTIEIKEYGRNGSLVAKVDNQTTTNDLKGIFSGL